MVLGDHARTSSAYGPIYTCRPVLTTAGALADLLTQALDRLPRDLFKPITLSTAKDWAATTLAIGTAAEGATIKEGSYLVHDGALVQIIDGAPQPVAVREGKGTEGIPATHARIIRGLIAVCDAVRQVLRDQADDRPWGSAQIRLRSAYASFVRNFGPINLTTISETVNAEGETRETFRRPNLAGKIKNKWPTPAARRRPSPPTLPARPAGLKSSSRPSTHPQENSISMSPSVIASVGAPSASNRLSASWRLRAFISSIFSSIVCDITSLWTKTGLSWPIRWARSIACSSTAGFHQGS
jgi:hypothetical protein